MKQVVLITLIILSVCHLYGQTSKYRVLSVPVYRYGSQMRMPWTGGMDSPEFSQVDLNNDGIPDLFVFDKVGNKVLTFLSNGDGSDTMYTYAPQYEVLFPPGLDEWALLIDYNHDGIPDIFTHSTYNNNAGIAVYKGSMQDGYLHYDLDCPLVTYIFAGDTGAPLFSNLNDVPVITDVNRDGGIDFLTYDPFGENIAYYQNLGPANPGNPAYSLDSFKVQLETSCWGNVAQNYLSNSMTLGQSCKGGPPGNPSGDTLPLDVRHSGNTIYPLIDPVYNDVDLLNGNIGYNNLVLLRNCGDSSYANICEWDSIYPTCTVPMFMASYPAAFGVDVDGDGLQDVLLAPNIPGVNYVGGGAGDNVNNVLYFKNTGDTSCWFSYQSDSFLVHHALDFGSDSRGLFYDFNGDGLLDLIVGNIGYFEQPYFVSSLAYYQNTGTATHPVFTEVTTDVNHISQYQLTNVNPTFGDLNGDGKNDLVIGEENGYLDYFQNMADSTGSDFPSMTASQYFDILVGDYPAPFLYDVNGDSLNDLIIGDNTGTLTYIPNTGTKTNAQFNMNNAISNWGNVNVTPANSNYGFSSPYIRKDSAGNMLLYVGSVNGNVFEYLIDPGQINGGSFTMLSSNFIGQSVGSMSTISIADINNDGKLEYLLGCGRGGLVMYSDSMWDPGTILGVADVRPADNELRIYPNPAKNNFTCVPENAAFINPKAGLYNLLGQQVTAVFSYAANRITVSTNALSAGLYIVRIIDEGKTYVAKVMIQQ